MDTIVTIIVILMVTILTVRVTTVYIYTHSKCNKNYNGEIMEKIHEEHPPSFLLA